VDWAIVITGVVGLAGIGGTLLSAGMASKSASENLRISISAEDARAKLAEKRRIYASCLAALMAYAAAIGDVTRGTELPPEQLAGLQEASNRARVTASTATWEVFLIGHMEVTGLASHALMDLLDAESDPESALAARTVVGLRTAMRRDLGEDV
jgi:hypothetical protein